jgi:hypothetical protein
MLSISATRGYQKPADIPRLHSYTHILYLYIVYIYIYLYTYKYTYIKTCIYIVGTWVCGLSYNSFIPVRKKFRRIENQTRIPYHGYKLIPRASFKTQILFGTEGDYRENYFISISIFSNVEGI